MEQGFVVSSTIAPRNQSASLAVLTFECVNINHAVTVYDGKGRPVHNDILLGKSLDRC